MNTIQQFYENNPRYTQAEQLVKILELIAQCQCMIATERDTCETLYGKAENGQIRCHQKNIDYINRYTNIINRLRSYYNGKIERLTKYTI